MAPDGEGSGGKHLAYQWKCWVPDSDRGWSGSAVLLPSSLLSGAVEVTARLKCCDDLDLLLKVLEANRALFVKADRLANEILTLSDEQAALLLPRWRFGQQRQRPSIAALTAPPPAPGEAPAPP